MEEKKFLYTSKGIILSLIIVAILASALSFFLPVDFRSDYDKSGLYWEIYSGINSSLYNEENFQVSDFFNYYLKSEKLDSYPLIDGDQVYENYSLVDFDKNHVRIRLDDYTEVNLYRSSEDEDVFLKSYKYGDEEETVSKINPNEFYNYNPLYEQNQVYKTNYLTSDKVFRRQYGPDFKFDPMTMEFSENYVYVVGTYNGKVAKFTKTNGGWDSRSTRALNDLQDAIEESYRNIDQRNQIKNLNFAYALDVSSPAYINYAAKADFNSSFFPRFVIFLCLAIGIYVLIGIFSAYEKTKDSKFYKTIAKFPIEVVIILGSLAFTFIGLYFDQVFLNTMAMSVEGEYGLGFFMEVLLIFLAGLCIYYIIYLFKDLGYRGSRGDLVSNSLIGRFFRFIKRKIGHPIKSLTSNLEGTKKTTVIIVLVVLEVLGLLGSIIFTRAPFLVFLCWTILIFGLAFFLRSYYDSILELEELSKKIKEGDFTTKVDEDKTRFKTLAHNLNTVSDNMDTAVENAIKSERMKTELITNVSHDLKTPLTSIINYSQLLLEENASEEDKAHYASVINEKSHKLKVLIENLFEVSKATSKAIDLNLEDIDLAQLVDQVLGEWEDKLEEKQISAQFTKPEDPVILKLDGNQTYRILENLLSNIYKYALESTRLYVDLKVTDRVYLTLKNISKYPLNISPDELLERFTRGDQSRNTEGSGLGLSIASSLTELQGGSFTLDIDGDLFKTTLIF